MHPGFRHIASSLFLLFALSLTLSYGQESRLTGNVTDSKTGDILAGAHIFVNKTTIGTASDQNGNYRLTGIPDGVQTIIISFIGFKDYIVEVDFTQVKNQRLEVKLESKAFSFNEVQVVSSNKEWRKNLKRFKTHFFGATINAGFMELVNPEVLTFENSGSRLITTAEAPLKIINNALGYEITYYLTKSISTDNYFDSSFIMEFKELTSESIEVLKNWHLEREKAYKGSFIHFLSTLSDSSYLKDGFKVFASKDDNLNNYDYKPEVDNPYAKELHLYEFAEIQKDNKRIKLSVPRNYDFLEVVYLKEEIDYPLMRRIKLKGSPSQVSWLEIPNDIAVINKQTGSYFDHFVFTIHGYWGWTNRIPELLPVNYTLQD